MNPLIMVQTIKALRADIIIVILTHADSYTPEEWHFQLNACAILETRAKFPYRGFRGSMIRYTNCTKFHHHCIRNW